ncbi:MAG TPA: DUF427 domain-containing protein [Mycobacteriales bacterium]|jgi:uncharacterized protein (DUF427 family)|nr:DUF427 domain-containing protein [Mycobacteriales bacterium]
MAADVLIPGPDHPITITRTGAHVVARAGTQVVADSSRTLSLAEASYPAVHYFPMADVDQALLRASDSSTHCPYKGDASYYSIAAAPDLELTDAAWSYRHPHDAVAEIAGYVAFYPDRIQIEELDHSEPG